MRMNQGMHLNLKPLTVLSLVALVSTACDSGGDGGNDASTSSNATTTMTSAMTEGNNQTGTAGGATAADESGEPGCAVTPGAWEAPDWDANVVEPLALRAQLDTLTGDATMRGAETGDVVVDDVATLSDLWNGDPSLADVANPGFAPIAEACFEEFVDVLAAGNASLLDAMGNWAPGPAGGIWGDDSRGINEGGLEVRQLVDKGGFSAGVLYAYAVSLTERDITPATIDTIAAAWGNNASLDPTGDLTDAASYSYQMGFHADMATALSAAKAYAADPACTTSRDEALVSFFNLWEQSMAARLVFYGNRAEGKLLAAMDDSGFAGVLHDLGEGLGVAVGFYGLPNPASGPLAGAVRIMTDDNIVAIMDAFGVDLDNLGASTTGSFVESLPNLEAAVEASEDVVMAVYGVDAATIMTYAMPTPG